MVKCFMVNTNYVESLLKKTVEINKNNNKERLKNDLQLFLKEYVNIEDILIKLSEEGIELRFK